MINASSEAIQALCAPERFIKHKVLVYFDGPQQPPTDITHDVMSIDILEELTSSSKLPFGEVSYNEATIQLDNITGIYSITNDNSPYVGKLVSNIKIKVQYSVRLDNDKFYTINGGTFYTDIWSADNSNSTVLLTCYDKLYTVGYKQVEAFPVQRNISFKDAYVMIMKSVGLSATEYAIDDNIEGMLDYFWCVGDTLTQCLNSLAISTCSNVYVDKNDIIRVESITNGDISDVAISDSNLIISAKNSPAYSNVCSGIRVKYKAVAGRKSVELYNNDELQLKPGVNNIQVLFSQSPAVALSGIVLLSRNKCYVDDFTYTDKSAVIAIINDETSDITTSIVVHGVVLETAEVTHYLEQDSPVTNILDVELPLVTSMDHVERLSRYILNMFSSITGLIDISMRGFPIIELGDISTINSPSSHLYGSFQIISVKTQMSEGLYCDIQVRTFNQEVAR